MTNAPHTTHYSRDFNSICGTLHAVCTDDAITELRFVTQHDKAHDDHPLLDALADWLDRSARDPRTETKLPLAPAGTEFECTVWDTLLTIPAGETRSYADIARTVGNPNASRAVGRANGANPIAILIPCHRVVASDGTLHGYAGGLDKKRRLLDHEGAQAPLFGHTGQ